MNSVKFLWIACRPGQWIKNLFIFLPVIFADRFTEWDIWLRAGEMFVCFSIAASSVYLGNDLADCENDKRHPVKRLRPIPSGKLSEPLAAAAAVFGAIISLFYAYWIHFWFGSVVLAYLATNWVYTRWLKQLVIIDVFCIAWFFVLRVAAVPLVLSVPFSLWMLIMVALLALFLAFNKRRYELNKLRKDSTFHRRVLRKYNAYFIDQMCSVITACILVVYILYVMDARQVAKFGSHNMIFTLPFVFYGVFRYQYLVFKRGLGGDPARIILSDKMILINCVLWVVVSALAVSAHSEWLPIRFQ